MMKTQEYSIRLAAVSDYCELGQVVFDAVRSGESPYSESQLAAWVAEPRSGVDWHERLNSQIVFVAESTDSLLGFMSLADGEYIDLAFIRPAARGVGVFRLLYNEIESVARRQHVRRLGVHSSVTARPAFSAVGFRVTKQETVDVGGVKLDRFMMRKYIGPPEAR